MTRRRIINEENTIDPAFEKMSTPLFTDLRCCDPEMGRKTRVLTSKEDRAEFCGTRSASPDAEFESEIDKADPCRRYL